MNRDTDNPWLKITAQNSTEETKTVHLVSDEIHSGAQDVSLVCNGTVFKGLTEALYTHRMSGQHRETVRRNN